VFFQGRIFIWGPIFQTRKLRQLGQSVRKQQGWDLPSSSRVPPRTLNPGFLIEVMERLQLGLYQVQCKGWRSSACENNQRCVGTVGTRKGASPAWGKSMGRGLPHS
jgi:hypothetical protein